MDPAGIEPATLAVLTPRDNPYTTEPRLFDDCSQIFSKYKEVSFLSADQPTNKCSLLEVRKHYYKELLLLCYHYYNRFKDEKFRGW